MVHFGDDKVLPPRVQRPVGHHRWSCVQQLECWKGEEVPIHWQRRLFYASYCYEALWPVGFLGQMFKVKGPIFEKLLTSFYWWSGNRSMMDSSPTMERSGDTRKVWVIKLYSRNSAMQDMRQMLPSSSVTARMETCKMRKYVLVQSTNCTGTK